MTDSTAKQEALVALTEAVAKLKAVDDNAYKLYAAEVEDILRRVAAAQAVAGNGG